MIKRLFGALSAVFVSGMCALGGPVTAPLNAPVVIGEWHSNFVAAKAKAIEANVPLLVIVSKLGCTYCTRLDTVLDRDDCKAYLAARGLVMVYHMATTMDPVAQWAGGGQSSTPMLRVTWFNGRESPPYRADRIWIRSTTFDDFRNNIEAAISAYDPAQNAPQGRDAYDPDNDTAGGAAELTWSDQAASVQNLKLATTGGEEPYADSQDWYKLAVVSGATYRVWFSGVSGIAADAPQAAIYGDPEATQEWAAPQALSGQAAFEGESVVDGTVYVKVWRATSTDTNILYTLNLQRFAPGLIEFVQNAVTVNENAGSVTLQVRRTGGTSGIATVQIGYQDRATPDAGYTATAGQDFNAAPAPASLTWADGDAATKTVTFALIKNVNEWEGAETFGVTLTPTTENAVGPDAVVTLNEVDPMVTRASSYTGLVGGRPLSGVRPTDRVTGTFQMTVSSAGKISGKAIFPRNAPVYAGSYSIRDARYQTIDLETGIATILGSLVQGRTVVPFELELHMERGSIEGVIGTGENARLCLMFRTDLGERADLLASLKGAYTVAFPVENAVWPEEGAPTGSGYATITVDARGRFRAAGKLPDGSSYSQSGELFVVPEDEETGVNGLPQAYAVLYGAPSAYEGGLFSGVLCFGDVNENGVWDVTAVDDYPFGCMSFKPTSVPVYNPAMPGFHVRLGVIGGWYDRYLPLHTVFQGFRLFVGPVAEPLPLPYVLSTRERNPDTGRIGTVRTQEEVPCVSWQSAQTLEIAVNAAGTGFVVPRADLVRTGYEASGQPVYNYDTGVNPNGVRVSFLRTSGVVRGSFKTFYDYVTSIDTTRDPETMRWRHTSKSVSYAGVLLQEQADNEDPVAVMIGHSLSAEKAVLPGTARTYSYKQSALFVFGVIANGGL